MTNQFLNDKSIFYSFRDGVTGLDTHTHTHTHVTGAVVHAQRRRETRNCSLRTAAMTTYTHIHLNNTQMDLYSGKDAALVRKEGRQQHLVRRQATRQAAAADEWLVRAHCLRAQRRGDRGNNTLTYQYCPGERPVRLRKKQYNRERDTHKHTRGSSEGAGSGAGKTERDPYAKQSEQKSGRAPPPAQVGWRGKRHSAHVVS